MLNARIFPCETPSICLTSWHWEARGHYLEVTSTRLNKKVVTGKNGMLLLLVNPKFFFQESL